MNRLARLITSVALLAGLSVLHAQAVKPQPYNAQLRTDPVVGNVQGVQRYGRSLKTDPDEGEGYSYHVYPVANDFRPVITTPAFQGSGQFNLSQPVVQGKSRAQQNKQLQDEVLRLNNLAKTATQPEVKAVFEELHDKKMKELMDIDKQTKKLQEEERKLNELSKSVTQTEAKDAFANRIKEIKQELGEGDEGKSAMTEMVPKAGPYLPTVQYQMPAGYADYGNPYPAPFDATAGIRNFGAETTVVTDAAGTSAYGAKVVGVSRAGAVSSVIELSHQPLIQVKVRVVEVARGHELLSSSVLDYITNYGAQSLIKANNINDNRQRTTGVTRFPVGDLISIGAGGGLGAVGTGSGMLVNLTSEHLNYIARFLATELNADLITAPEVVTLNGQNVEFVAGSRLPFALGQNVIQGNSANIQQFFYKHVGSYISVTPRIVNWGLHGDGEGAAVLNASDIADWVELMRFVKAKTMFDTNGDANLRNSVATLMTLQSKLDEEATAKMTPPERVAVPTDVRGKLLDYLKQYSKTELVCKGLPIKADSECQCQCNWSPQDCTIDLTVVVRLSDAGKITVTQTSEAKTTSIDSTTETDIRAIANVIQVKSGHGVVMAGLIGEREIEEIAKVPVLGDVPVLGFLFRSKGKNRQKTEVLIFIEAQVLDQRPEAARAQSARNFTLGQAYVAGEFLENPLEYGMHRAGFGAYLPPHSKAEHIYWERLGRKVRKICTTVDDIFE